MQENLNSLFYTLETMLLKNEEYINSAYTIHLDIDWNNKRFMKDIYKWYEFSIDCMTLLLIDAVMLFLGFVVQPIWIALPLALLIVFIWEYSYTNDNKIETLGSLFKEFSDKVSLSEYLQEECTKYQEKISFMVEKDSV